MPEELLETQQPAQAAETRPFDWPKIILAAVLGFGFLAGSAYAGYYYGTQQVQPAKEPTPVVSQPTTKPTPTPTSPIKDQTIEWETYENVKLDFRIDYPSDFKVEDYSGVYEDRCGNKESFFAFVSPGLKFEGPWLDKYDFFVSVTDGCTEKSGEGEGEEAYLFGQQGGWRNVFETKEVAGVLQIGRVTYSVVRDNQLYHLSFSQKYPPDEYLDWTRKIADSFKFIGE